MLGADTKVDDLGDLAARCGDGPVFAVTLLRYNDRATGEGPQTGAARSGRETYRERYMPAFRQATADQGVITFWMAEVLDGAARGAADRWDDIAIIGYPNLETYRRCAEATGSGSDVDVHRDAALADWRTMLASEIALPD